MIPSRTLFERMVELLAEDTTTLAQAADNNLVKLVISDFTPNQDLVIGSLTLASFTGSAPKLVGLDAQPVLIDPATNLRTIMLKEPALGWTWICTAAPDPSQTVYGYIVTDEAGTTLLGSGKLATPVTIQAVGEAIIIGNIRLSFLDNSPF